MAIFNIFKLPENKRFEYKPIYFDKRKEELAKKISDAQKLKEIKEHNFYKTEIKGKFKSEFQKNSLLRQNRNSNIRIGIIIMFLGLILYYVKINNDLISRMIEILYSK
jgi:hypothetical protein